MAAHRRSTLVPSWISFFNPIARLLLAAGVPMGPDVLITVRGRKSGLPRTTPVTICENSGRRGLISPFGEVNWVRNLRAAGRATITVGRRKEEVTAVELGPTEAAEFIRDVLAPHARRTRLGSWFVRTIDKIDIDNPVGAAEGRPVFELRPVDQFAESCGGLRSPLDRRTHISVSGRRHATPVTRPQRRPRASVSGDRATSRPRTRGARSGRPRPGCRWRRDLST
jgi:deazaflavin-dependent oxidoreductase (nitroreductase family)